MTHLQLIFTTDILLTDKIQLYAKDPHKCGSFEYKWILSVFVSWFIRLSNASVFPDPEPPTFNILYGWTGISAQFGLCFLCLLL